jgi:hypothetical protein
MSTNFWLPAASVNAQSGNDSPQRSYVPRKTAPSGIKACSLSWGWLVNDTLTSTDPAMGATSAASILLPKGTMVFYDALTYGDPRKNRNGIEDQRWYRLQVLPLNLDSSGAVMQALSVPYAAAEEHCSQMFAEWYNAPPYVGWHAGEDWARRQTDGSVVPFDVRSVGVGVLRRRAHSSSGAGWILTLEHSSYSLSRQKLFSQFHHMSTDAGVVGRLYAKGEVIGRNASVSEMVAAGSHMPCHLHWEMRLVPAADWGKEIDGYRCNFRTNNAGYYPVLEDMQADGYRSPTIAVRAGQFTMSSNTVHGRNASVRVPYLPAKT